MGATILVKKYITCGTPMLVEVPKGLSEFYGLRISQDGEKTYSMVFFGYGKSKLT